MSVHDIERLEKDFRKDHPEVADMLLQAAERAKVLVGVPGRYPRDERFLGSAREQYLSLRREFKAKPHTPDLIQRYWQGRWNWLGRRIGLDGGELEIPEHGYYQDEIDGLEKEMSPRRKLVYGHNRFYQTLQGLSDLSRIHPKMRGWVDKPDTDLTRVTHSSNQGGWFHIEADCQTPFTKTTQEGLENELEELARTHKAYTWKGQRLPTYVIGSADSKDLNGHYFDESGWVRLLGSFGGGEVLRASFYSSGRLPFGWGLGPLVQPSHLGGRFEGAKP